MINITTWKLITLFLIFSFLAIFNISDQAVANDNMQGIYILPTEGKGIDVRIAKAPFVTGYSVRVPWKVLEPIKGRYDWQPIDNIINLARNNGKFVTLRILAGIQSPKWLMDNPEIPQLKYINKNRNQANNFNKPVTLPQPWDSSYLKEYSRFLEALAKQYANEPLLYWVAVSGPVIGSATPYLHKNKETRRAMKQQGYTPEKWRRVWEEAIDYTAQAFPNKSISLCLDVPPFYPELADQLAEYAVGKYGKRVCLQSNGLSAKALGVSNRKRINPAIEHVNSILQNYKGKATIGFQMTWAAAWKDRGRDRLGPLDQAIDAGIKLGATYLEIYQDDIIDPANNAILTDASKRLGAIISTGEK